jgi:hypothetical protein
MAKYLQQIFTPNLILILTTYGSIPPIWLFERQILFSKQNSIKHTTTVLVGFNNVINWKKDFMTPEKKKLVTSEHFGILS